MRARSQAERLSLDVFVLVLMRVLVRRPWLTQAGRLEEVHLLIAVARRREERADTRDAFGDQADFLVAFPDRRARDVLAGLQTAGRQLPRDTADGVPVLLTR